MTSEQQLKLWALGDIYTGHPKAMRILTIEQRKIVLHGYYKVNTEYAREMILRYVHRSLRRKEVWRHNP